MLEAGDLKIRFWGVRGSRPVPGPTTVEVGGNSSCVEVRAGDRCVVFDAGTGIVPCGESLVRRAPTGTVDLFLSHLHHDHIEGLRFFAPLYRKDWRCRVYGPETATGDFGDRLRATMGGHLFPVEMEELPAGLEIRGLAEHEGVRLAGTPAIRVDSSHCPAHPKFGVRLYRLHYAGRRIVYATDVEAPCDGFEQIVRFAKGADVLIHDAQYTDHDYFRPRDNRQGWGHSTVRMAAEAARAAGVGRLLLFHHDPSRHDTEVAELERTARAVFPRSKAAYEGLILRLSATAKRARRSPTARR